MSKNSSGMTMKDLQQLQDQLIELRQQNYDLCDQLKKAKQRSNLSPAELCEAQKNDNLQLRQRINQAIQEREQLTERLKLIKIEQFLKRQNIVEADQFPDTKSMTPELASVANDVLKLIDAIRSQIIRRKTVEIQVNECGKKTKTLGHISDDIQNEINKLRDQQKSLISDIDLERQTVAKLEAIAASLHAKQKINDQQQFIDYTPKKLEDLTNQNEEIEQEIKSLSEEHTNTKSKYTELLMSLEREIEDSNASKNVLEKKIQQQIWSLQSEINKRRGVVVLASKSGSSHDAQKLFIQSNELIQQIASKQQEVWELEERVAFSRASMHLMAEEILKQQLGGAPIKQEEKVECIKLISSIAELERKKKSLKKK